MKGLMIVFGLLFAQVAGASEECLDWEGIVVNSESDQEASQELARLRASIKKYFFTMGHEGNHTPTRISWSEARELVLFLAQEDFVIQLGRGENSFFESSFWGLSTGLLTYGILQNPGRSWIHPFNLIVMAGGVFVGTSFFVDKCWLDIEPRSLGDIYR